MVHAQFSYWGDRGWTIGSSGRYTWFGNCNGSSTVVGKTILIILINIL